MDKHRKSELVSFRISRLYDFIQAKFMHYHFFIQKSIVYEKIIIIDLYEVQCECVRVNSPSNSMCTLHLCCYAIEREDQPTNKMLKKSPVHGRVFYVSRCRVVIHFTLFIYRIFVALTLWNRCLRTWEEQTSAGETNKLVGFQFT